MSITTFLLKAHYIKWNYISWDFELLSYFPKSNYYFDLGNSIAIESNSQRISHAITSCDGMTKSKS